VENIRRRFQEKIPDDGLYPSVELYLRPWIQEYEEEMERFTASAPPDPRFVKFFLFSP
jgi:hypothetical protein